MLDAAQPNSARIALLISLVIILMVPIIRVVPELDTYIHPWRPEIVSGILLAGFCIWALLDSGFKTFIVDLPAAELRGILLPAAGVILWSAASAIWAGSIPSVVHHTCVWIVYLSFYLLARYLLRGWVSQQILVMALLSFVGMICLPAVIEYYSIVVGGSDPTALARRYSKYTEIANTILPLIVAFSVLNRGLRRYVGCVATILIGLFDASSLSRVGTGMYLVVLVSFALMAFTVRRFRKYRRVTVQLCTLGIASVLLSNLALALVVGNSPIIDRIQSPLAAESVETRGFFRTIAFDMFRTHPLTGIGADNFGQDFVRFRRQYSAKNPADPQLALADFALAERTHNEYLQIGAELGLVGITLFAFFLAGILYASINILRSGSHISLITSSAFIGIAAFLSSSFFTSYSFRMLQNGLAFFVVLAISVSGTIGRKNPLKPRLFGTRNATLVILAVFVGACSLVWYSAYRVQAVRVAISGYMVNDVDERSRIFDRAEHIDPENATLAMAHGLDLLENKRFAEASLEIRRSIDAGKASVIEYSYLATAQILAEDRPAAEATVREALGAYPYSTFMHVRLAAILSESGREPESKTEMERARSINSADAETWWNYLTMGGVKATKIAFDEKLTPLMDLRPNQAVYAVKTERELRFPDEKFTIPPPPSE